MARTRIEKSKHSVASAEMRENGFPVTCVGKYVE